MKELEKLIEEGNKTLLNCSSETVFNRIITEKFQKIEKNYTLRDIEKVAQKILKDPTKDNRSGFTISVLINQKIKPKDTITLEVLKKDAYSTKEGKKLGISGLGQLLPRGRIIINGDVGYATGIWMTGGEIIINGNTQEYTGTEMTGGKIIIKGNAQQCCGMQGGLIAVEESIQPISFKAGIIIENSIIKKLNLDGWDINTITMIDKYLPTQVVEKILEAYAQKNNYKNLEQLVLKPENYEKYRLNQYKTRLRELDQELPVTIRKIGEPEEKLAALKALEKEANNNPEKEIIKLARTCGANTEDAVKKYNQKIKKEIQGYKKTIARRKKELL